MSEAIIEAKHLILKFGSKIVLDNLSCSFEKGLTHVILGSSGSGKSSFLRLAMGLIWPESGEIKIYGTSMAPQTQRSLVRKIGYMVQDGGLFPHLSSRENVELPAKILGWQKTQIERRIEELRELMELGSEILDQFPTELSGGQKQRISLMRALMLEPQVLLLDEPLTALDPLIRYQLQTELKRIFNKLKKTVIIVTHDLSEAAYFGHTVTVFNAGKIEQIGTYEDLVLRPKTKFVEEFVNAQRPATLSGISK